MTGQSENQTGASAVRLRREKVGVVVSNKMEKTAVIKVERMVRHPLFKKYYRRSKKYLAHDANNVCGIGDQVVIIETRPLSKNKRWSVKSVLQKAQTDALVE